MHNMINKNILMANLIEDEDDSNYISINELYVSNNKYLAYRLTYRCLYRSFTEIERPYFGLDALLKLDLHTRMIIINFYNIKVI